MKNIILCTFFVAMCVLAEEKGSKEEFERQFEGQCVDVTHHSDGSISALTCAYWQCAPGEHIGYREKDLSKPYPACCRVPICKG